jgi:hypothetical protein
VGRAFPAHSGSHPSMGTKQQRAGDILCRHHLCLAFAGSIDWVFLVVVPAVMQGIAAVSIGGGLVCQIRHAGICCCLEAGCVPHNGTCLLSAHRNRAVFGGSQQRCYGFAAGQAFVRLGQTCAVMDIRCSAGLVPV